MIICNDSVLGNYCEDSAVTYDWQDSDWDCKSNPDCYNMVLVLFSVVSLLMILVTVIIVIIALPFYCVKRAYFNNARKGEVYATAPVSGVPPMAMPYYTVPPQYQLELIPNTPIYRLSTPSPSAPTSSPPLSRSPSPSAPLPSASTTSAPSPSAPSPNAPLPIAPSPSTSSPNDG